MWRRRLLLLAAHANDFLQPSVEEGFFRLFLGLVLQRPSKASSSLRPLNVYEPVHIRRVVIGMPVMPNKALRIMIADTDPSHRMKLEYLFNQQGYFRIAPVSSAQELMTLMAFGIEPFDLLVVDACLAEGLLDLPGFFIDNPQVRHGMIYNAQQAGLLSVPVARRASVQLHPAQLPDLVALARLMARVDPTDCEAAPAWKRPLRHSHGG